MICTKMFKSSNYINKTSVLSTENTPVEYFDRIELRVKNKQYFLKYILNLLLNLLSEFIKPVNKIRTKDYSRFYINCL